MESIDRLIDRNHKMIMENNSLEICDNLDYELSKEFEYLIKEEAQHLRIRGRTNYYFKIRKVFVDLFWKIKSKVDKVALKIDTFLYRIGIYKNIVRPLIKKMYLYLRPQKKVRINRLFRLNDEEFIKELYQVFLNREADAEGYKHNLTILTSHECDRLDMIYIFNNSFEGGRIPVKITGKYLLRRKKANQK